MAINIFGNASTILPFPLMFNIKASQDVFTGDLKRATKLFMSTLDKNLLTFSFLNWKILKHNFHSSLFLLQMSIKYNCFV